MNKGEGELLLQVDCQLLHAEGMKEFETYHLATALVMTVSSKKHQWILNLVSEHFIRNSMFS